MQREAKLALITEKTIPNNSSRFVYMNFLDSLLIKLLFILFVIDNHLQQQQRAAHSLFLVLWPAR